ncbi:polycomb group RING finger protein 6-like [Mytilus trossulus]|uniref:polycomb group RING finger protein 6-like n=1 Tax=Mytilus trossulus TaxID=6551 RepID=UPI0030075604
METCETSSEIKEQCEGKLCCVLCAKNEEETVNEEKISLHCLPGTDDDRREEWLGKIKQAKPDVLISDHTRLCNLHFEDNICDNDSVPTKLCVDSIEQKDNSKDEKVDENLNTTESNLNKEEDTEQPSCSTVLNNSQSEEKPEPKLSLKEQLAQIPVCPSLSKEPVSVRLCAINTYITCALCGGYLYEASTITECMHTFCKTCIVRHIEKCLSCPTCDTEIHPTDPIVNIRHDSTIQDIVYRLLPNVAEEEQKREKEYYEEHERKTGEKILPKLTLPPPPPTTPPAHSHDPFSFPVQRKKKAHSRGSRRQIRREIKKYFNTNFVSLQLEYEGDGNMEDCPLLQVELDKKFLRVTCKATVGNIATFIRKKLQLEKFYHIDLYHPTTTAFHLVPANNSLEKVREQYYEGEDVIMELRYRITEDL